MTTTSAAVPTVPTAVLAFTGNVRGWVEPCGCTADPLGGVDRIKAELAKTRQTTPTLFFDTGGLLFDRMDIPAPAVCQEEAQWSGNPMKDISMSLRTWCHQTGARANWISIMAPVRALSKQLKSGQAAKRGAVLI